MSFESLLRQVALSEGSQQHCGVETSGGEELGQSRGRLDPLQLVLLPLYPLLHLSHTSDPSTVETEGIPPRYLPDTQFLH